MTIFLLIILCIHTLIGLFFLFLLFSIPDLVPLTKMEWAKEILLCLFWLPFVVVKFIYLKIKNSYGTQ